MPLTLAQLPGFCDQPDSGLAAGSGVFDFALMKMSENAKFGCVTPEIFYGEYQDGDTVPLPTSLADGNVYTRSECMYVWTRRYGYDTASNRPSAAGNVLLESTTVDQNTGEVSILTAYYVQGGQQTNTADGVLAVWTIAQRGKGLLSASSQPAFTDIPDSTWNQDAAFKTSDVVHLNQNCKRAALSTEFFFNPAGYSNGQTVPLPTSTVDGYPYARGELKYFPFWMYTGNPSRSGPSGAGRIRLKNLSVNSSTGVVSCQVNYWNGKKETVTQDGIIGVLVIATRTMPTLSATASTFVDLDPSRFWVGQTLDDVYVKQLNQNAKFANLRPEIFVGTYTNGQTVPLPTSTKDGYPYARGELQYIYSCANTGAATAAILGENYSVSPATGLVSITVDSLTDGGTRMTQTNPTLFVVTVARRAHQNADVTVPLTSNAQDQPGSPDVLGIHNDAIMHSGTVAGGANCYSYRQISTQSVTVAASDTLEYDVRFDFTVAVNNCVGGIDARASDGSLFRDGAFGFKDQNGSNVWAVLSSARNKWYHRTFDLTAWAGKTITSWASFLEGDQAGFVMMRTMNIVVRDSTGEVKAVIYSYGPLGSTPVWIGGGESGYSNVRIHSSQIFTGAVRADLHAVWSDGTTVESLKPAEAGAEVTTGKSITVLTDRILDNIGDGPLYARPVASSLYQGNPAYRTSKAAILSLSPTHYWPLDNTSLVDLGASPSNLTQVGTIKASGLSLSPGDHVVGTFTNNDSSSALYASATGATTWTIMAWTVPGFFQWATTSGIIGRSNAVPFNAATSYEPHLYISGSGFVYAAIWNGSQAIIKSSYAPNWNIPHHLAVTFSGGTLTLYIDGMVAAQASGLGTENPAAENTWTVGAVYGNGWPSPLGSGWSLNSNGTNLQDVAVWEGTALTPLQIQRIVVSGGGRFASLSSVLDDSGRKARTGAHSTYRPLSNPLTATDAGSNVTITISAFTMRIGGTDVSISGSTITGLGYNTLYYIYYDDANMAGGAVTFVAVTSKETALAGDGRFFVGSILTPPSGGSATVGNNDGGAGAQVGFLERFWPTAAPSGNYLRPENAFDRNTSTYSLCVALTGSTLQQTWSGFPQSGRETLATSIVLKVLSSVTNAVSTDTVKLSYSVNDGGTWTDIYSVSANRALTLDSVSLTLPVATSRVQVLASVIAGSYSTNTTHKIYEIWLEVNS